VACASDAQGKEQIAPPAERERQKNKKKKKNSMFVERE
jgi:hypothetical protein